VNGIPQVGHEGHTICCLLIFVLKTGFYRTLSSCLGKINVTRALKESYVFIILLRHHNCC